MQSITSSQIQPVAPIETEVQSLEKLLSQIFSEHAVHEPPLVPAVSAVDKNLMDFSPFFEYALDSDQSEISGRSIIEADDSDRYAQVVEIQKDELFKLRAQERKLVNQIRSLELDIASKDEQLQYLPEYFQQALMLGELQIAHEELKDELVKERLINNENSRKLDLLQSDLNEYKKTLWYKIASFFGLTLP